MQCNVGQVEKIVRALIGFPMAIAGFYVKDLYELAGNILLWAGLCLLLTAVFTWCPATWLTQTVIRKPATES